MAARIAEVERTCGIRTSIEEYQAQFKFGLVEVVYEWARGMVRCFILSSNHFILYLFV